MLMASLGLYAGGSFALAQPASPESKPGLRTAYRFDFGPGKVEPGYTAAQATTFYTPELGYGFETGAAVTGLDCGGPDALCSDFCTGTHPFLFSVRLPEGNYRVRVILGDPASETTTTIKAELRRLMLENVHTAAGQFKIRSFAVNLRTPRLANGGEVRLKEREKTTEWVDWDDKLTLEFNGSRPCICALEIAPADTVTTVYLLGDSTVCDQPSEPWNSWGQMLPRFFKADVAIANHAESGESLRSSLGAHRLDKVMGLIKPGDSLFVQYGHNDMKEKGQGVGAFTTYKTDLKRFVTETRRRGGLPVLITSMERKAGVERDTLGDYPEAVRQLAREEQVPLIDLHAMSRKLYRALGSENIDKAFQDGTHHNNYGSYELAQCVVEGIKANQLGLARHLVDDVPAFDPSRPDPPAEFRVPASPAISKTTPLGN
jgi:lysophospholipase L1-like esterase